MDASGSVTNQAIWAALQQMKAANKANRLLETNMDKIQTSLTAVEGKLSTLGDQVEELKHRVSSNQDNITELEVRVKKLEKENAYLREKAEADRNRSRSWNKQRAETSWASWTS